MDEERSLEDAQVDAMADAMAVGEVGKAGKEASQWVRRRRHAR
jgi:hypothetical protein